MTQYPKVISYGGVRNGARTSNGLGPQFGTEPAPRIARADQNGFAPRSHCASPAQPRTGRNNRNGHVPPGSSHSWHTSQEAQIELATRREDHVTRTMDRSTRSRRGMIPLGSSHNDTISQSKNLRRRSERGQHLERPRPPVRYGVRTSNCAG